MHWRNAGLIAIFVALFWHAPARASGDFGCTPSWRLGHSELTGCDNMAILQPGNDTRVNLALLLLDLRGARPAAAKPADSPLFDWDSFAAALYPEAKKPEGDDNFSDGEGSRCRSDATGEADFTAAVIATKLAEPERAALTAARHGLAPDCAKASGGAEAIKALDGQMKSPLGKAFAHYLAGALAFYDADYDTASARFALLRGVGQPWLKEAARYMLGRVEVNRLQIDAFDDYGALNDKRQIDEKAVANGEAALRGYLHDFPTGRYANSARGLLRRIYWLAGKRDKLAAEYAALLALPPDRRGISEPDLIQEIDNKLLPGLAVDETGNPILLAVLDLQAMRHSDGAKDSKPLARSVIEAQRAAFAANPALFDFLLAAHAHFVAHDDAQIPRLIPDAAHQASFDALQFSRQALRGMALDALKDRNARGFWLDMLASARGAFQRPAIELALAMHDERSDALARVFEKGSPVELPAIREILLTTVAPATLLRQQAKDMTLPQHERELALFTLLYKEATRGPWREFIADLAMVPANAPTEGRSYDLSQGDRPYLAVFTKGSVPTDYGCPPLKDIAGALARDPGDPRARLCLGEFVRVKSFDGYVLDSQPPATDLGGTRSLFPGKPYSRLEAYKALIADAKVTPPDKAYALYRAVNCYAPSGNNECGGTDVPTSERKAWFNRLKQDYPGSRWAKELQYYW